MKIALPEKLTRNETILLCFLLVAILGITVVFIIPKVFPSITHSESEVGASLIDVERQKPLNVKFDVGLFTDPRWKNFKRVSSEVSTGQLGRPNPFAPVVSAEPAPTENIGASNRTSNGL